MLGTTIRLLALMAHRKEPKNSYEGEPTKLRVRTTLLRTGLLARNNFRVARHRPPIAFARSIMEFPATGLDPKQPKQLPD